MVSSTVRQKCYKQKYQNYCCSSENTTVNDKFLNYPLSMYVHEPGFITELRQYSGSSGTATLRGFKSSRAFFLIAVTPFASA